MRSLCYMRLLMARTTGNTELIQNMLLNVVALPSQLKIVWFACVHKLAWALLV